MDRVSPKVADVLDRAADLIEVRGWTQGEYARSKTGRKVKTGRNAACFCALGAINVAAGYRPNEDYRPAQEVLETLLTSDQWDIPYWNDDPTRTQAEVVEKLRAAASLAREPGEGDRHG